MADVAPGEEEDNSSPITFDISIRKTPSRDELVILTVPSLKEMLRDAGKPVGGKKAELIDSLLLDLKSWCLLAIDSFCNLHWL